jgi:serine/threonine protein phosphatase PrpC
MQAVPALQAVWKVIGASVTGTSHLAVGTQCQDASDWRVQAGLTCLAVADGAGSRPRSGQGASLAVRHALQAAGELAGGAGDPASWLRLTFARARDQVNALAAADRRDAGDYATTLAVAVLTPEVIVIGQVGDTIAVTGSAGQYATLAPAPQGEYVNETTFITQPGALDELRVTITAAAGVDAVFLSTDGLRFKILDDLAVSTPFRPFFEDLTTYARSASATTDAVRRFLAGLDDQSGDDKTLLAAVRTYGSEGR